MLSKAEVLTAVTEAFSVPFEVSRSCGCGRAYVCVTADRATVNAVAAAAKKLGLTFLRKAYGTAGNAFYVGYDNADGKAFAKAFAVAEELTKRGVPAYFDGVSD